MYDIILIRYGEIALKGKNRSRFVRQLIDNINQQLQDTGDYSLERTYGRIYIEPKGKNTEEILQRLKSLQVFREEVTNFPVTFKVITKRTDKSFPLTSPEISRKIGAHILNNTPDPDLSVDVHNPEVEFKIEIRKDKIYIFTRTIDGPGGLPIGSSGRALLLLSGGIDSPVAGWMSMTRGIELEALYFHSFPYTGDRAREKVVDLTRRLSELGGDIRLHTGHFTEIQKAIQEKCPEKSRITIMRRMMFRMAEKIARENGIFTLITGESVGQVASQTLESINTIDRVTSLPVLRPLVALNKNKIMDTARKIGTYDISIRPHEDCCTIFVPDNPETRPTPEAAKKYEKNLVIEQLITEALKKTETEIIGPAGRKNN
ncbi:MAG: tRNA uracil 4-sulfurtransferase ThiI [Halanaerobiales bacterium]